MPQEGRVCGGCTACCRTHAILEIGKPAGEWCPHCEIGRSCKIYSKKPPTCTEFKCAWLAGLGRTEDRPDKVHVVIEADQNEILGRVLMLFETNEWGLASDYARITTRLNLEIDIAVMHLPLIGVPKVYLPKNREVLFTECRVHGANGSIKFAEIVLFMKGRF